jgi:hypothetical protein
MMRDYYERELATLLERIATGQADQDTVQAFGLVAELYARALATANYDANIAQHAQWRKHVTNVEAINDRTAAALERIASALEWLAPLLESEAQP